MKSRFTAGVAGVVTLAASAGIVLLSAGVANAATPPWEPDTAGSVGTIAFYNSSGTQIYSGNFNDSPFAAYAVGSTPVRSGDASAGLYGAQPNPDKSTTSWNTELLSGFTSYPLGSSSGAPANIQTLSQTDPVVTGQSGDETLQTFIDDYPNEGSSAGNQCAYKADDGNCDNVNYENLYQLRIRTANSANQQTPKYDDASILVSNATYDSSGNILSGTWTQVYPTPKNNTSSTLSPSENPGYTGDTIVYTDTITGGSSYTGTVNFTDGGTTISGCGAETVNSSGVATCSTSYSGTGSHNIVATFAGDSANNGSTSNTVSETIDAPATSTTTSLATDGNQTTAGKSTTLTATVSPSAAAGTVAFTDNGTTISGCGSEALTVSGGSATATCPTSFAAGPEHNVVATFNPTNAANYKSSHSATVSFYSQPPAGTSCASESSPTTGCTDTQTITGTIPPGTLSISTPYTASNALNVGTLALNTTGTPGTYYTASATFKCITVTDATSGGSPFTASALANPLSLVPGSSVGTQNESGAYTTINGENVGLTGLAPSPSTANYCPGNTTAVNSYTKAITPTNNPAALGVAPSDTGRSGLGDGSSSPTPHTVLTGTSGGDGTATYDGTLTLNAPTSTEDGQYTGTIVFTVTD